MEELTKRNGKGAWFREIEKVLKRFDASIEWFMERVDMREEEIEKVRLDREIQESEKAKTLRAKKDEKHRGSR